MKKNMEKWTDKNGIVTGLVKDTKGIIMVRMDRHGDKYFRLIGGHLIKCIGLIEIPGRPTEHIKARVTLDQWNEYHRNHPTAILHRQEY